MEFHIVNTQVYGLNKSIIASGNPMRTLMVDNTLKYTDKDLKRAIALGTTRAGEGHDQLLTGCIVQFDMYAPSYMSKEIQRYHFLDFISSQSTMHILVKFKIKENCVEDTDRLILERYQELLDDYNDNKGMTISADEDKKKWRTLVASLPCGFVLGATMTTNYRQLKTIHSQRKNHKLKEWHEFCSWCESLPMFKELCISQDK